MPCQTVRMQGAQAQGYSGLANVLKDSLPWTHGAIKVCN